MDQGEPPRIVFEEPSPCPDTARTEATLRRTLEPSRAPAPGWTVTLRIARAGGHLEAEGEITDAAHAPVAHRTFSQPSSECRSLARAVGVWASIVLDAEDDRAKGAATQGDAPTVPAPPSPAPVSASVASAEIAPERPLEAPRAEPTRAAGGIDIGATSFLVGGLGTPSLIGPSVFTMIQVGEATWVRPAISYGRSVRAIDGSSDMGASWGAARFDLCSRITGAYGDSHGLQFDVCGGAELGFVHIDTGESAAEVADASLSHTIPTLDLGPSAAMRGDIDAYFSLEIRGYGFFNVMREAYADQNLGVLVQPSYFGGRVEVALAWRMR